MSAKQATKQATKPAAPTSTANVLAQAGGTQAAPAAAIKKPAVVYVNGLAAGAPANAPAVTLGGTVYNGTLPATNPGNRGTVGTVKTPAATVTLGNGKSPRSAHGAVMWQAVVAALPCTAAQAATAAGSGGAAFVAYAIKNGWLTVSK